MYKYANFGGIFKNNSKNPLKTSTQIFKMSQYKAPLFIKKLDPSAFLPKKGSEKAAGYDICSLHDCVVPAHGKCLVKTGLAFAVPSGNYARVAPRSGLALKNFIDVGAGVIDEDYRGEGDLINNRYIYY